MRTYSIAVNSSSLLKITTGRDDFTDYDVELFARFKSRYDNLGVSYDTEYEALGTTQFYREQRQLQLEERILKKQHEMGLVVSPEEMEFRALAEGKPKPISIWHRGDQIAYYRATEEERQAWNLYANNEARKFQGDLDAYETVHGHIGYDRDGKITNWCPPMFFPEWLAARKNG